jgi:hypothetical protein
MTIHFDSNLVLSRKQREERLTRTKRSLCDIGEIVNAAKEEKKREHQKSLFVQGYDLFSKCKKPLEVIIRLNLEQAQTTQSYGEYSKLSGLVRRRTMLLLAMVYN